MKLNPDEPLAVLAEAHLLRRKGQLAEALPVYDRAIALDPMLVDAHIGRERLLVGLGRADEAIQGLEKARAIDPLHPEVPDYALFAAYCDAFGRWHEASEKLRASSLILKTLDGNLIQNPYVAIANRAIDQMTKIAAEFGLTPSARSRISVPEPKDVDQLEMELSGPSAQIVK